jgi:hypothetical protein
MPIILDTQEAEIRRITVQSQPGKTVHKTLSQKYPTQKSVGEWLKHQYCKKKKKNKNKKKIVLSPQKLYGSL